MNIIGEIVYLRAIEPNDKSLLLELINCPDTEYMLGGKSFPISEYNQAKWIENLTNTDKTMRCIIVDKASDVAVGTIILTDIDYINGNTQIHIKLSESYRGKGFATDAIKCVLDYAFKELRLKTVYSEIIQYNVASIKLFEKCRFKCDGVLRSRIFKRGSYYDVFSYSYVNQTDL